ncbi:glycosyltransferase family 2 protein [uncultured Pseudodesulfovibrio sp.]|uniref:glycosyltransferase family 2 protein n=1 Tax=uncultured Pseudodesulfovibrio sp. TaxID=2035858 RepID=UPI0029C9070D|nr:glycosyltransferase family 2 protein [uncultured Pseudodesulfovibrio sp.]
MARHRFSLSIVIPVWNGWDLTEPCLRSLAEHTPDDDFQVVLADNGSTDQTATAAPTLGQALFGDRFIHHRLPGNLGFAKACNAGAQASSAANLFFLNNDTRVTANWLPPLMEALRADRRLAGVGPLLLFPEDESVRAGRVQHLGIAVADNMEFRHLYEYFPPDHPAVQRQRTFSVITAAALLMPAPLFRAHGGFHEEFVNGMEDVDLCCRIAQKGGRFSVIPQSIIHHHTHGTEGRFDHESANLRLLRARCRDAREDFCALLREDGFEPVLTPWLDLAVQPSASRLAELNAVLHASPEIHRLQTLLLQEPFWDQGYARLAALFEQQAQPREAMAAAYLRSLLCPGLDALRECTRLLRLCDIPRMADRYATRLAALEDTLADREGLRKKARSLLHTTHDDAVRRQLETFLAE